MTPTDPHRPSREAHEYAAAAHGPHDHVYDDSSLLNEDVAHEHSDVNVRALLMFCVGLMVVTGVVMVAMWGLFRVFERQAAANDPVVSPLAHPAGQRPPEPRLLENEPQNLRQFRASQTEALKGIEDAKKRLLEAGLPVRSDAPADAWLGTGSPARGESSSGRAIPVKPGGQ